MGQGDGGGAAGHRHAVAHAVGAGGACGGVGQAELGAIDRGFFVAGAVQACDGELQAGNGLACVYRTGGCGAEQGLRECGVGVVDGGRGDAEGGGVVGAGDRKAGRHVGGRYAVRHLHGEAVGDGLVCGERLGRCAAVVQRVADHASGHGQGGGAVGACLGVGGAGVGGAPAVAGEVRAVIAGRAVYIAFGQGNSGASRACGGIAHATGFHQLGALCACSDGGGVVGASDVYRQSFTVQEAAVAGRDGETFSLVGADGIDGGGVGHVDVRPVAALDVQRAVGAHFLDVVGHRVDHVGAASGGAREAVAQGGPAVHVRRAQGAGLVGKGVCRCGVGQGDGCWGSEHGGFVDIGDAGRDRLFGGFCRVSAYVGGDDGEAVAGFGLKVSAGFERDGAGRGVDVQQSLVAGGRFEAVGDSTVSQRSVGVGAGGGVDDRRGGGVFCHGAGGAAGEHGRVVVQVGDRNAYRLFGRFRYITTYVGGDDGEAVAGFGLKVSAGFERDGAGRGVDVQQSLVAGGRFEAVGDSTVSQRSVGVGAGGGVDDRRGGGVFCHGAGGAAGEHGRVVIAVNRKLEDARCGRLGVQRQIGLFGGDAVEAIGQHSACVVKGPCPQVVGQGGAFALAVDEQLDGGAAQSRAREGEGVVVGDAVRGVGARVLADAGDHRGAGRAGADQVVGVGQRSRTGGYGIVASSVLDACAVGNQGVGIDADAVCIRITCQDFVGKAQRTGASACAVVGQHDGATDVELELGFVAVGVGGDKHGFAEGDGNGDGVVRVQDVVLNAGGAADGWAAQHGGSYVVKQQCFAGRGGGVADLVADLGGHAHVAVGKAGQIRALGRRERPDAVAYGGGFDQSVGWGGRVGEGNGDGLPVLCAHTGAANAQLGRFGQVDLVVASLDIVDGDGGGQGVDQHRATLGGGGGGRATDGAVQLHLDAVALAADELVCPTGVVRQAPAVGGRVGRV